jgi:hypothetical protein
MGERDRERMLGAVRDYKRERSGANFEALLRVCLHEKD